MRPDEKPTFLAVLSCTFRTVRQPLPDAEVLRVWWEKFEPFPLEVVATALSKHVDVSEFAPTPAAVLRHMPKRRDERPDADEAWAIAVRAADERETVVWTKEIAEAWTAAQPVFDIGDDVGARMAFKAAYVRLIEQACATGHPLQWVISQGFDAERRREVVNNAVRDGRLQLELVRAAVPLLTTPDDHAPLDACARGYLKRLKVFCSRVVGIGVRTAAAKARQAEEQRAQLAESKRALDERVVRYKRRVPGGKP
jgi:hypothetical protein